MQPLQYYLRYPAAKDNSITHAAAAPSNLDSAITMHFAASRRKPARSCTYLRTSQHQMTTIMQPFQCDLQPQIQETHRTTHTGTQEQRLVAEHRGGTKTTPAATAAHMRQLSSPAAATWHGNTQGFVLRLPPHNTEHATFMQPFQCDLQPQIQETHGTTHRNIGRTTRCRTQRRNQNHPRRNRRTHKVRFLAGCSHFTRKNTRLRAPASSPQHRTCNIHAAIPTRSATTDSRNAWNYPHRNIGRTTCCRTQRRNQNDPSRNRRTQSRIFVLDPIVVNQWHIREQILRQGVISSPLGRASR